MIKRSLYFSVLLSTLMLKAADYTQYAVPADIKAILDAHQEEIIRNTKAVAEYPWLPGFFIKRDKYRHDSERMRGYAKAKQTIAEHPRELSLIKLAKKFHYQPKPNDYGCVVAEKIAGVTGSKVLMNLEQAQQLASFIRYSGWKDAQRNNFAVTDDGNIYIVDTKQILGFDPELSLSQLHHHIKLTDGKDDIFDKYIQGLLANPLTYSY